MMSTLDLSSYDARVLLKEGTHIFLGTAVSLHKIMFIKAPVKLSGQQKSASPVMIMHPDDFVQLDNIMSTNGNRNAFGEAHATVNVNTKLVWAFPVDLLELHSIDKTYFDNVQMISGQNPLVTDAWFIPKVTQYFEIFKHHDFHLPVELKGNTDFSKIRVNVHGMPVHLLTDGTLTLPAIQTYHWMRNFDDAEYRSKNELARDMQKLEEVMGNLASIGIYAFPVHKKHHLIVFVADDNGVFTVERFVKYLEANSHIIRLSLNIQPEDFNEWSRAYESFDAAAFKKGLWHAPSSIESPMGCPKIPSGLPTENTQCKYKKSDSYKHLQKHCKKLRTDHPSSELKCNTKADELVSDLCRIYKQSQSR